MIDILVDLGPGCASHMGLMLNTPFIGIFILSLHHLFFPFFFKLIPLVSLEIDQNNIYQKALTILVWDGVDGKGGIQMTLSLSNKHTSNSKIVHYNTSRD